TAAIVAQGDVSGAAYLCDNYSNGGFDDWYLPSASEVNHFYNAAFIINKVLGPTNGFKFGYYWSSSEYSATNASTQLFNLGFTSGFTKSSLYTVSAVRRF